MKNKIILIFFCFAFLLSGCSGKDYNPMVPANQNSVSKRAQLKEYDSPYTLCRKNKDGTYSLYTFAAPVQFRSVSGYSFIDNSLVASKNGFAFENKANEVKCFFPARLEDHFKIVREDEFLSFRFSVPSGFSSAQKGRYINSAGDAVEAISYEKTGMRLWFYATRAGIAFEAVYDGSEVPPLAFEVSSSARFAENHQNGYVLLKDGSPTVGIINCMSARYDDERQLDIPIETETVSEGNFKASFSINNDGRAFTAESSFSLYQNKIPDTAVYSKEESNEFLSSYACIGTSPEKGDGWLYTRFRMNYIYGISPESIVSSEYYIRQLGGTLEASNIEIFKPAENWTSTGMTWQKRILPGEKLPISGEKQKNGWITVNLTDFTKECYSDPQWAAESAGLLIKAENPDAYAMLATSDHPVYAPYLVTTVSKLPESFFPPDDINPSDD